MVRNIINIEIPGYKDLKIKNLVLDYNGTIAQNGKLIPGVREKINTLAEKISVYILTADTYNTVREECKGLKVQFGILKQKMGGPEKEEYVKKLGPDCTVAIGNGENDSLMLKKAALGIAVIGGEGAALKAVMSADIIVRDIIDGFVLLQNPRAITATLRR